MVLHEMDHIPQTDEPKVFEDIVKSYRCGSGNEKTMYQQDLRTGPTVAVVGFDGSVLPLGLVGELVLRRPIKQERSQEPGGCRLTHSGILASFSHDQGIHIVSITDRIIESISSTLRALEGVTDATLCDSHHGSTEKLCIFVAVPGQLEGSDALSRIEKLVIDVVKRRLPQDLSPSSVCFVEDIPITRKGRVDRKRLFRQVNSSDPQAVTEASETWTEAESLVKSVFQEMSKWNSGHISRNTTMFQLGIDSIGAIQVATKLRKSYKEVTARDILEHPTCSDLARFLTAGKSSPRRPSDGTALHEFDSEQRIEIATKHGVDADDMELVLPCTQMQSGLLARSIRTDGETYINHIALDLPATFTTDEIESAWSTAVRKHQMLRTGFSRTNIAKTPFVMINYIDTSQFRSQFSRDEQLSPTTWRHSSTKQMLACLHEPQWRVLVQPNASTLRFHLLIHHALYDAVSLQLMISSFWSELNGNAFTKEQSILPVLSGILEAETLQAPVHDEFWQHHCEGMSATKFPNMSPLRVPSTRWASQEARFSMPLSKVEEICAQMGSTTQAIAQIAWAYLLSMYTGEPVVTFGVVLSGRDTQEANVTCFPQLATVPFCCNVSPEKAAVLKQALDFGSSVRRHMFTPLSTIQRVAGSGDQVLFDNVFAYQRQLAGSSDAPKVQAVHSPTEVNLCDAKDRERITNVA